jgi:SAM-dependent methyltransferase
MGGEFVRVAELGWPIPPESEDGVRYLAGSGGDALSYPDEGLEVLGLEGGAGYWFDHRAACVARVLARLRVANMWEVGSGTGAMASRLIPPLTEVVTVEPLAEGARAAARLGLPALCGTLQDLQLPDQSIECIGAFDVIEHIPDAADFLNEIHRVLRPGGVAVVTVPAFSMLWGDEDDAAGHQRRYTKTSLIAQFQASGFTPLHTEYLYASLVPPAALARALPYRLGRRRSEAQVLASLRSQLDVPPSIDLIARKVLATETAIARHLALPFGLSVQGAFRTV